MRRFTRLVSIALIISITAVLMAVVAGLIYLNTSHFRRTALALANGAIPGTISAARHDLSISSGTITLYDVAIAEPSGALPVTLAQLQLQLRWRSLLRREIVLNRVLVVSPRVRLVQAPDGVLNITRAFVKPDGAPVPPDTSREKGGFPFNVIVRSLEIAEGGFSFAMPEAPFETRVSKIDLQADFDLYRLSTNITLDTGLLEVDAGQKRMHLDHLHTRAHFEKDRLRLETLETGVHSSKVQLSGRAGDLFSRPDIDAKIDLDVELSDLADLLALENRMTGRVKGSLDARGGLEAPHLEARLTYGGGRIFRQDVEGAELQIDLTDRLLSINKLQVSILDGQLKGEGSLDARQMLPDGWLPFAPQFEHLIYDLQIKLQDLALEKLRMKDFPLGGLAGGDFILKGEGVDPHQLSARADIAISVAGLSAPSLERPLDTRLTGSAGISEGVVALDALNGRLGEGEVALDASGTLNLKDQALGASLHLDAANLADLLGVFGISGGRGAAALDAEVTGKLKQPDLHLTFSGTQLGYDRYQAGDLNGTVHLDPRGELTVSQLDLKNQDAVVRGEGRMALYSDTAKAGNSPNLPMDMNFRFSGLVPAYFHPDLPVEGTISGKLHLGGRIREPEADLTLQARALRVWDQPVGETGLRLHYEKGEIHLRELNVERGPSTLRASGGVSLLHPENFKLRDNPSLSLELSAGNLAIEDFTPMAKGRVDLSARIDGSVKDPGGKIDLTAKSLEIQGQPVQSIRLHTRIEDRKAYLAPLRVNLTASDQVVAEGWLGFDRTFNIKLHSDGVSLEQIHVVREMEYVKGLLLLDLKAEGSLADPRIDGEARITELKLNGHALDDFTLQLNVDARKARAKAALNFDAEAEYGFDTRDFSLSTVFRQTELKPYFALSGQPGLTGSVTGTINAKGNTADLKAANAAIALSLLELNFKDTPLIRTGQLNAKLENFGFDLEKTEFSLLSLGDLQVRGKGRFNGPLSVEVGGHVPLKILAPLTDEVSGYSGRVVLDARIAGEMTAPSVTASLAFEDMGCTIAALGEKLQQVNGRVRVDPGQVVVDDLKGRLGKGNFSLKGRLEMDHLKPDAVNLAFEAHRLPLDIPEMMDITTNASLKFQGTPDKTYLSGQIELLEGLYYKDVNLNPLRGMGQRRRESTPRPPREISLPYLRNLALNLEIKRRNPFVVDNNIAYLEISPDLKLSGSLNAPVASGRAQVDTGEIYYYGKTFIVKKGVVDFLNPYTIEPTVDIHSEVTVRDWLITLLVSGTPDNLKVELSSNPPEENADILSLLLLGKTSAELRGGGEVETQSPAQMMTQLMASTFGEDIKNATGVDILEVETTDNTGGETSDLIKVTVGKKLSERLTVKYSVSSRSDGAVQRAISEYQFLDNMIVSGFQDTRGVYGGELVFRIEFR